MIAPSLVWCVQLTHIYRRSFGNIYVHEIVNCHAIHLEHQGTKGPKDTWISDANQPFKEPYVAYTWGVSHLDLPYQQPTTTMRQLLQKTLEGASYDESCSHPGSSTVQLSTLMSLSIHWRALCAGGWPGRWSALDNTLECTGQQHTHVSQEAPSERDGTADHAASATLFKSCGSQPRMAAARVAVGATNRLHKALTQPQLLATMTLLATSLPPIMLSTNTRSSYHVGQVLSSY
jgi:hypothetical protein